MSKYIYDEYKQKFDIEDALTIVKGKWADGNINNEDRIGYFVTSDNDKNEVEIANADSYICGVTIQNETFLYPDSDDPSYCIVQSLGLCMVKDDGTLAPGDKCMPNDLGIAVRSSNNLGYRVVNRIDDNHIQIIVAPNNDMVQRIKEINSITTATLVAGQKQITLLNSRITTTSILSFYTSIFGVNPEAVTVTNGSVTLTFDAQSENMEVGVRIDG